MRKTTLTDHDVGKLAAQYLLKNGLATYAEIAALSGRSREIVRFWAIQTGTETARQEHLEKIWAQALRQVSRR